MTTITPGLYCEHGVDVAVGDQCRHGCTATVPLCVGCSHEPHSPYHCVMLVEKESELPGWRTLDSCGCALDSYAEVSKS